MAEVLLAFFRTGLYGSLMILFILLLRPLLDKAPRNVLCVLWLLVAVRLLLPSDWFTLASPFGRGGRAKRGRRGQACKALSASR